MARANPGAFLFNSQVNLRGAATINLCGGLLTSFATPHIRASSGLGVAPAADIRTEVVKIRTLVVPILWKLTASAP